MKLACWFDVNDHYFLKSILYDDQLVNFFQIDRVVFQNFWVFVLETLCSSQFCEFELNCTALGHASCHLIYTCIIQIFVQYLFCANLQSALVFFVLCVLFLILALRLGKLEPIGPPPLPLSLPLGVRCLGMTKAERPLRIWIVSIRFGLSVLWF